MSGLILLLLSAPARADDAECTISVCEDEDRCASDVAAALSDAEARAAALSGGAQVCIEDGEYAGDIQVPAGVWSLRGTDGPPPVISGTVRVGADTHLTAFQIRVFGPVGKRAFELQDNARLNLRGCVVGGGGGLQASDGGVIRARGPVQLDLLETDIGYGQAYGDGGLISAPQGRVHIGGGTRLHDGSSLQGAGGLISAAEIHIDDMHTDGSRTEVVLAVGRAEGPGGAIAVSEASTISGQVSLRANRSAAGGGAIAVLGDASLILGDPLETPRLPGEDRGPELRANTAGTDGGAVWVAPGATISAHWASFLDNVAINGGAIALGGEGSTVAHSLLCGNRATESGGAIDATQTGGVSMRHSIVYANTAALYGALSGGSHQIVHTSIIGNSARSSESAINTRVASSLDHSIVAFNTVEQPIQGVLSAPRGTHVIWHGNGEPMSTSFTASTDADPLLSTSDDASVCDGAAVWPLHPSPARDIGGEALGIETDPDGSPLDAGPFSGESWPQLYIDDDGDGFPRLYDCRERDAAVHPGAADPPYDGTDSDCLGDDDFDADGDGHRPFEEDLPPSAQGLGFDGEDCDDTRADRSPDNLELPATGIDEDCDGSADEAGPLVPAGCHSAPGPWGWGSLLALGAVRRRRRSTRS